MADDMLSLRRLETAIPAMVPYRAAIPRGVRWEELHEDLGVELPPDFQALAEAYPPLLLDDFLLVNLPELGMESSFVAEVREMAEIVKDLSEAGYSKGYVPYPEPGGRWSGRDRTPATASSGGRGRRPLPTGRSW